MSHRSAPPRLVLASGSPRRRELLERLGLAFEVVPPPEGLEPPWDGTVPPLDFAAELARRKVSAVSAVRPDAIVLGADTIVVLDGAVLGKPRDEHDARAMLLRLAGREHLVHTAVSVDVVGDDGRRAASAIETTTVRFRPLEVDQIAAYVATGEPLDKAGAYGIQGFGAALVESVHGCFFNVMGLPVTRVLALLEGIGFRYEFPGRLAPR